MEFRIVMQFRQEERLGLLLEPEIVSDEECAFIARELSKESKKS